MSRRNRPGVGRIKFKGLRFFRQIAGDRMSQKELVELVRRFFSSKGLFVEELTIEFKMTLRPTSEIDGAIRTVWGLMHHGKDRVEVFLVPIAYSEDWLRSILNVIGHELDHVAWEKEGRKFDFSLRYQYQPHEIRARKTGSRWELRATS